MTWEYQRRNHSLSRALDCEFHEILSPVKGRIGRYLHCIIKTWKLLKRSNAEVIFAQNPSIVLALQVVLYGRLFRKKTVIDCHNAGLLPAEGASPLLNWVAAQIPRQSTLTIVTNEALSERVRELGGTPFVLPDPIRALETDARAELAGTFKLFLICTYADDEPFLEVFEAATLLDSDIQIYVSGNYHNRNSINTDTLAENIHLTGYLANEDYAATLNGADAIIDLTYRKDCLVCGAYEAIAAGKPLLLSSDASAKVLFNRGVLFTDNSAVDIAQKIQQLRQDQDRLSREIIQLRAAMIEAEQANYAALDHLLSRQDH